MEEDILIKRRYSIPYELFGEAFRAFQKKFVYPRNMIMTLLLVLAAAANVVNIALGNNHESGNKNDDKDKHGGRCKGGRNIHNPYGG